jgi:hypothetical protein
MKCEGGEIGRRTGLKILRWQHRAGSIPALRTPCGRGNWLRLDNISGSAG